MKLKLVYSLFFSMMAGTALAQIPTVDVQSVCKKRISGYVAGLETALATAPANSAAKAELDRINRLSDSLEPCDKLQQIPALANSDSALDYAGDSITKNK